MKNNISKNIITGALIFGAMILISKTAYADDIEKAINAYLKDPSFDFLGHKYEKILFDNIIKTSEKGWSKNEVLSKLQFIKTDIKTIPLQTKCSFKIFEQNIGAYAGLGGLYGAKASMGTKAFNKLAKIMFKFVIKY